MYININIINKLNGIQLFQFDFRDNFRDLASIYTFLVTFLSLFLDYIADDSKSCPNSAVFNYAYYSQIPDLDVTFDSSSESRSVEVSCSSYRSQCLHCMCFYYAAKSLPCSNLLRSQSIPAGKAYINHAAITFSNTW